MRKNPQDEHARHEQGWNDLAILALSLGRGSTKSLSKKEEFMKEKVTFVIPRMEGISKAALFAVVNAEIHDLNLRHESIFLAEFKKACTEWVKTTSDGKALWHNSCQDLNIGDIVQEGNIEAIGTLMNGVVDKSLDIDIYGADSASDWFYDTILVDQDEETDEIYSAEIKASMNATDSPKQS